MVSDFTEQQVAYLWKEEAAQASTTVNKTARAPLKYVAEKESYRNSEWLITNVVDAVSIENSNVFIFDQSRCYKA